MDGVSLLKKHFLETKETLKKVDKHTIAKWLLNEGYYPEQYVLPPSFKANDVALQPLPYEKNSRKLRLIERKKLVSITYPKSLLTSRQFSIQHPKYYHDIVFHLIENWEKVTEHLFNDQVKIYSYSFPIPLTKRKEGKLSSLRSGRMIYEWLEMAEKDLVAEANNYKTLVRADITNFYNSIYTHSIAWALHGREDSLKDARFNTNQDFELFGNKIDKLFQYANDARTNGIPVGPALSDLIAEIVLTQIDTSISKNLQKIKFLGSRFKDDYRILCNSDHDANIILQELSKELERYNLHVNEHKTKKYELPEGLYRQHNREYQLYSLKEKDEILFNSFELTLLKVLDIHRAYPGTSIIEKFLGELFSENGKKLKLKYSNYNPTEKKQILKTFSLLMLLKRESNKTLSQVLAICEAIYVKYDKKHNLKPFLIELVKNEIRLASAEKSTFELVWFVFFSEYLKLEIKNFDCLIESFESIKENEFLKSILESNQAFFREEGFKLFSKPKDCQGETLACRFAVFNRDNE